MYKSVAECCIAIGQLQVELGVLKGHFLQTQNLFHDLLVWQDLVSFIAFTLIQVYRSRLVGTLASFRLTSLLGDNTIIGSFKGWALRLSSLWIVLALSCWLQATVLLPWILRNLQRSQGWWRLIVIPKWQEFVDLEPWVISTSTESLDVHSSKASNVSELGLGFCMP